MFTKGFDKFLQTIKVFVPLFFPQIQEALVAHFLLSLRRSTQTHHRGSCHYHRCVGSSSTKSLPPFAHFRATVALLRSGVRLSIFLIHINIRVRIVQQIQRRCSNAHSTSLIQVKFLRFQQGFSVTG